MTYFPNFIGQDAVKETMGVFLDAAKNGKVVPHLLAVASKGVGKTLFCRKFADYLDKEIIEVNGGDMKSPKQVAESLFDAIQGKPTTIFVDEVHAAPKTVENMLLTVLNPEPTHKTSVTINGMTYNFDFANLHTFIFATTEPQNIFIPLRDRLEEITFDDYTPFELAYILNQNCNGVALTDDVLNEMAKFSRGNARWAAKTGKKIESFCAAKGLTKFDISDIISFNKSMGIYPLGLTKAEINLLAILKDYPSGATLTKLASRTGNTTVSQRDVEKYLLKHNLMEIDGTRKITQLGIELLKSL